MRAVWERLPAYDEKKDLLGWHYCFYNARRVPRTLPPEVKRSGSTVYHSDSCISSRLKLSGTINPFHHTPSWCEQGLHFCTATMAAVFSKVQMHIAFPDCLILCLLWIKTFQSQWTDVTSSWRVCSLHLGRVIAPSWFVYLEMEVNNVNWNAGYYMFLDFNPYPTAFPYGNGMVLHFYQQQESSTTKTVHKVTNKGLKTYV